MLLQNLQAEFIESMFSDIKNGDILNDPEHSVIYANNVISSLTRALENTYPMINKIIGDHFFQNAAKEYILRYPSTSSNLNEYGEYFSDFLKFFEPATEFDYLPEVALFEWTTHEIQTAGDADDFSLKDLEQYTPEEYPNLHFTLNPASRVLHFDYPILDIIELCENPDSGPINLESGGIDLLILRHGGKFRLIPLTPGEYTFLLALSFNQSLSVALDATLSANNEFLLEESLPKWIGSGVITGFYLHTTNS